jgi:sporulation protein YlmC with PRC-barrel domain
MMQTPGSVTASAGNDDVSGHPLISAAKVQGATVFDTEGERLGHVEDLMLHKVSGQVAYAILSFGGLLGVGERSTPLPWSVLTYDPGRRGYVVPLSKERLRDGPHLDRNELTGEDNGWSARVNDYYQVTPSWA